MRCHGYAARVGVDERGSHLVVGDGGAGRRIDARDGRYLWSGGERLGDVEDMDGAVLAVHRALGGRTATDTREAGPAQDGSPLSGGLAAGAAVPGAEGAPRYPAGEGGGVVRVFADHDFACRAVAALGAAFRERGWSAQVLLGRERPVVRVCHPELPVLKEDVGVAGERFVWSWGDPICPVAEIGRAVERVARVLSPGTPGP
ncbi:hypothetical protein D5H75_35065 [Bailinhaonella thermotolerans]|uniref:Uncharacterized protein n=1 Tax=Bailinhaonella thermotolerans TaxID=1070861 RepID=A0A3A4AB90_9ACTN|nr:hypothetical protein D5H75_35065 [Bailinhaonella thermotolerans]